MSRSHNDNRPTQGRPTSRIVAPGPYPLRRARPRLPAQGQGTEPTQRNASRVELVMRAELARHLDVIVVIWTLALVVSFSLVTLSRAQLTNDQWSHAPQAGPIWVVPGDAQGS